MKKVFICLVKNMINILKLKIFIIFLISSNTYANICNDYNMKPGLFTYNIKSKSFKSFAKTNSKYNYDKVKISPAGNKMVFLRCIRDIDKDCFCSDAEYLHKEIVLTDIDGSNEVIISPNKGGFNDYPNWSPDGSKILFMFSKAPFIADSDLYIYDLNSEKVKKLTSTPNLMESDNYWNANNSISVLAQKIKSNGHPEEVNNLYEFSIYNPTNITQLTFDDNSLGRHCCTADPKYSYDMKYLSYARFTKTNGIEGDWDIFLKDRNGNIFDLSNNETMDLWPMWSRINSSLLWVRWDAEHQEYIIAIKKNLHDKNYINHKMIGKGIKHSFEEKNLLFALIRWPDWHPTISNEIYFSSIQTIY